MQIEEISDQNLKNKKLPAKTVVIQLLDKNSKHLAFIACRHEYIFSLFDSANDRETSHFLEEISDFEAELLTDYFQIAPEMKEKFGGFTGELIITGANSEIVHHERPEPINKNTKENYTAAISAESCVTSRSLTA